MKPIKEVVEYISVNMANAKTADEYLMYVDILKYMLVPYILYDKDVLIEFEIDEIKSYKEYCEYMNGWTIPPSSILNKEEWNMIKELLNYGKKEFKNVKKQKI